MSFTILIQGPLREVSLKNVNNYLKFGKVVISHWDQDDTSLLNLIDSSHFDSGRVTVCSQYMQSREEWESTWDGDVKVQSTFPWAVKTTYYGLQHVNTKYVVKVRSDEMFEDLSPIIDLFLKTKKMVFGNIYAYKFNHDPYKIGDHIFVDFTDKLIKTYEKIIESDEFRYPTYCAEHILMINHIRANYNHLVGDMFEHGTRSVHKRSDQLHNQKKYCKMIFECVNINLLKDFVLCPRENNFSSKEKGYWDSPGVVKSTEEFFS